jgi:tagatose-1,6-bisphosphate aldolase
MTRAPGQRDSFAPGARRGLAACASPRGTFAVLALDHRQNLRRELRPDDPGSVTYDEMVEFKRAVVRALSPVATGTLLDPEIGAAQSIADGSLPARAGLIVAIEATGYEGPSTARVSRILDGWSVEKAKRMGASAAKLLVYYHPDAANAADQERLVATVAADCRAVDLALFVEPLSFSLVDGAKLSGEDRRRVVVETARRLTAIGGDVLKAEFPYDPRVTDHERWGEACEELDAASGLPWVLLSGGVDDATFEAQVAAACVAGASGVLVGRSVWAEAAAMAPAARDEFLLTTGRDRLRRLADLADRSGRTWHERRTRLTSAPMPADGWFREY